MSRPGLHHAYLDTAKSRLLATNGTIAAILPVSCDETDAPGWLTDDTLKAARKCSRDSAVYLAAGPVMAKMPNGMELERPQLGNYPNMDAVIPSEETKFSASLDPEQLIALAHAIGASRGVTLEFCGDGKAIRVKPCNNPRAKKPNGKIAGYAPAELGALGLIMPVLL